MKASEIVDKLKSVLLSAEEPQAEVAEEQVELSEEPQAEVEEVEVNEPTELAEDGEDIPEAEAPEEPKYATKEELESAVAEMRAMYDKLMENMSADEMEAEVPQELSKQEPVELSAEEPVEPIAHTPEVESEQRQQVRFAANRPMSTLDRVFAQLNQIKK